MRKGSSEMMPWSGPRLVLMEINKWSSLGPMKEISKRYPKVVNSQRFYAQWGVSNIMPKDNSFVFQLWEEELTGVVHTATTYTHTMYGGVSNTKIFPEGNTLQRELSKKKWFGQIQLVLWWQRWPWMLTSVATPSNHHTHHTRLVRHAPATKKNKWELPYLRNTSIFHPHLSPTKTSTNSQLLVSCNVFGGKTTMTHEFYLILRMFTHILLRHPWSNLQMFHDVNIMTSTFTGYAIIIHIKSQYLYSTCFPNVHIHRVACLLHSHPKSSAS